MFIESAHSVFMFVEVVQTMQTIAIMALMHTFHELDLNLLRVFDAVMTTRNITAAAQRLGLTQSSTSHSLNRLRVFFDDALFVRTKRSMEPTPHAIDLARPISESLTMLQSMVGRVCYFDPIAANRTFNIAMTDIGQTIYLPKLIPHLASAAPNVDLVIHQLSRETLRDRLESGALDLAIGPLEGLQAGFYQQRLYDSAWICAFRVDHPRIHDELTLDLFLSEQHLLIAPPGTIHQGVVETTLGELGRKRRVTVRVPHFHVAAPILGASDLIAAVPQGFIEVENASDSLRSLPLPFHTEKLVIRQFWHERFHEDSQNQWLRQQVLKLFGEVH